MEARLVWELRETEELLLGEGCFAEWGGDICKGQAAKDFEREEERFH